MKHHSIKIAFTVVYLSLLMFGTLPAFAAPPILNYQGTLTDDAGLPVTGTKDMTFKIYDNINDPTPLWSSTISGVVVKNGFFSQNLGEQDAFPAGLFDNDSLFLGVTVDGTELVPRKRLTSVPYALNSAIPKGAIIMWSGAIDQIPSGWALCNGQNGTPDLRDRFIVGAGGGYNVKAIGGLAETNHNHIIPQEAPGTSYVADHSHHVDYTVGCNAGDCIDNADDGGKPVGSDSHQHRMVFDTWGAGGHSHVVNAHGHGGTTGSITLDNRPPYFALCFIMKL